MTRAMKKTILVVDDQPQVRRLMRGILDRDGYAVIEAEDESTAIDAVRRHQHNVDLALVDIELPGPNGRQVAGTLNRMGIVQTIFVTGLDPDALFADGRLEEGDPLLRKPFTVAGLSGAVKATLKPAPQPLV